MARALVTDDEVKTLCIKGWGSGRAWALREATKRGLDKGRTSCPHCGTQGAGLMPPDFETLHCENCGRNSQIKDFSVGSPLASGFVPFDLTGPSKPKKPKKDRKKKTKDLSSADAAQPSVVAAGLAVRAEDTGRVLMLQRANDPSDPAAGAFEFGGGHLEAGETPFAAACREWSEEVGCPVPVGQVVGMWQGANGIYEGFVLSVPHESEVPINLDYPRVDNPDAELHAKPETAVWMSIDDLHGMPALRRELLADLPRVLPALRAPVRNLSKSADEPRMQGASINESDVLDYLQEHYPNGDLGWVRRCLWVKDNVLLKDIDYENRPGGIDEDKVEDMADKLEDGWDPHPVVLVAGTGDPQLSVADGYHRLNGLDKAGQGAAEAWVGTPKPGNDGWRADVLAMQFSATNHGDS